MHCSEKLDLELERLDALEGRLGALEERRGEMLETIARDTDATTKSLARMSFGARKRQDD